MKFTGLPVKVGDAFLLQSPYGYTLVDAGQNKKHILELIKLERITSKHINLLMCTHYDADHINGILGILESGDYTFDEIWLPEILGSLTYTISEDLMAILQKLRELNREGIIDLITRARDSQLSDMLPLAQGENPIKVANLDALREEPLFSICLNDFTWRLLSFWPRLSNAEVPVQTMLTNISKAIRMVSSSLSSGANVRWFKFCDHLTDMDYGFGMSAMNSAETAVTIYHPDVFIQQLYLTTINIESLVFKFSHEKYPNVLFCADSNLSFADKPIQQPIHLEDSSVVTAPHHGADSCDDAYKRIEGKDLIYVRSDKSQKRRPGKGYLRQPNIYCTICKNKGPTQKVWISYKGRSPNVHGNRCKCEFI